MSETCVMCGRAIPEGRWACPVCERKAGEEETMIIATYKYKDGTEEVREYASMVKAAKYADDHDAIIEFKASQISASQIRQGRTK